MDKDLRDIQRDLGCSECFYADYWAFKKALPCCTKITLSYCVDNKTGFCSDFKKEAVKNGRK